MPDVVSITRAKFPKNRADDVVTQFQNDVIPTFQQMKNNGRVKEAFFVIDRDGGEAIGIAIYNDEQDLQSEEGERGRAPGAAQRIKDPQNAATGFAKHRAKSVRDSGANMEQSDWYELIGQV